MSTTARNAETQCHSDVFLCILLHALRLVCYESCIQPLSAYIDALGGVPIHASWRTMAERLLKSWAAGEATSPTTTEKPPLRVSHDEETPLLSSTRGSETSEGEMGPSRK